MSDLADDAALYAGPVIDAHHHVWDLERHDYPWLQPETLVAHRYGDYTSIKHTYLPQDYRHDVAGTQVVASVYMEAEWNPADPLGETAFVSSLAEKTGVPGAMAAQAWLDAPDVADVLAAQAAKALVRSIRHKPAEIAGAAAHTTARTQLSEDRWRSGYALLASHGLHFELQTPWRHLAEATELARDFPETLMVINHAGVIADRDPETIMAWRAALEQIADRPNVVIKASGLCVPGQQWTTELNRGVILDLVRIFGSERVMFGSNFPVDKMFTSYEKLLTAYFEATEHLSTPQQHNIFFATAQRVYHPHAFISLDR